VKASKKECCCEENSVSGPGAENSAQSRASYQTRTYDEEREEQRSG
jgi:hypothetical protein